MNQAMRASGAEGYTSKSDTYFDSARRDFVSLLADNPTATILEIGCGSGGTGGLALDSGKCGTYIGIELMAGPAEAARQHIDDVLVGDIERMELPFEPETFDALIMSEVLEHLADPWAVLVRIRPFMKPGALVLASSPNVSHSSVIWQLLRGRFDLADEGVMDRTHLRWFTPATYAQMFRDCGYDVDRTFPIKPLALRQRIYSAMLGGADHFHIRQICVQAHVPGASAVGGPVSP